VTGPPTLWEKLLVGVSPGIGVVKIQQEFETKLLGLPGRRQSVIQSVGQPRRRVEQPQSYPVVTMVVEDLEAVLGLAIIPEHRAPRLGLSQERKVGPDGIISRPRHRSEAELQQDDDTEAGQDGPHSHCLISKAADFTGSVNATPAQVQTR